LGWKYEVVVVLVVVNGVVNGEIAADLKSGKD